MESRTSPAGRALLASPPPRLHGRRPHRRRLSRLLRAGVAAGVVLAGTLLTAGGAAAHDADVVTDPPSGAYLEEPITEIYFEFDEPIGDDTEIAVFDPNEEQLESETRRVSETAAVATFDELDVSGAYVARYLTTSVADGHLLVGAITFTYGSGSSSGPSALVWVLMGAGAILILSTGAFFSYRRYRELSAAGGADSQVDDDLSDVGV